MEPINYNIRPANPQNSFLQGMQQGWGIEQQMQQQQAQQQQMQQQQMQQQQMQQDLAGLSKNPNPTATDFARMTIKYPQLAEHLKNAWAPLNEEQKNNKLSAASQVFSAVNAGKPDIALEILSKQAEAAKNSGNNEAAQEAKILSKLIEISPEAAKTSVGMSLMAVMGSERFAANFESLAKTPLEAQKLGLEAANMPIKQGLENQAALEDIQSKKLKRQLDVLDAQIKTTDSEAKRGELQIKRDQLNTEFSDKQVAKTEAAQATLGGVEDQLATVDKVLSSPQLKAWAAPGTASYQVRLRSPFANDVKDFDVLLETVGSQQLLGNLMELKKIGGTMGALSEKEGKVLEGAKASLKTAQSSDSLVNALKVIRASLVRTQRALVASGNLPADNKGVGGTFVMNHPKFGVITDSFVNKMMKEHPGATKEQVLQYLQSDGAPAAVQTSAPRTGASGGY